MCNNNTHKYLQQTSLIGQNRQKFKRRKKNELSFFIKLKLLVIKTGSISKVLERYLRKKIHMNKQILWKILGTFILALQTESISDS